MGRFGLNWEGHVERIEQSWNEDVAAKDTVILCGDLDWALHLEDAMNTLTRLHSWSGRKLLLRGNHDYWWSSKATNKVRQILPPSIELIHNNAFQIEGFNIVGAKGSPVPGGIDWTGVDAKLLNRETERLKLSLERRSPGLPTITALHYPPFYPSSGRTEYVDLMEEALTLVCVYGHLHGDAAVMGPQGLHEGIRYRCVAADNVGFRPVPIAKDGTLLTV